MTESPSILTPHLVAAIIWVVMIGALAFERRLDFVVNELPSRPAQVVGAVLLVTVLVLCVFLPIAFPASELPDVSQLRFGDMFIAHLTIGAFLASWWLLGGRPRLPEFVFLQVPTANDWRAGLSLGVVSWVGTLTFAGIAGYLLGLEAESFESTGPPVLMLWIVKLALWQRILIVLAAMTFEEMFFRGFLQPRIGFAPSTILFTLAHAAYGMPLMMISIGVFSIIVGGYFERTSRLLPCIVAHGVFDGVQLLIVLPYAAEMIKRLPVQ